MTEIPFLSEAEYQKPRTPKELVAWTEFVDRMFGEKEETKWIARFGQGIAKEYFEEARPVAQFVRANYANRNDLTVRLFLGNQSFDAILSFKDGTVFREQKVECVTAMDGHEEHLRMQYMKEHGHVSLTGSVSYSGTKNTGYEIAIPSVAKPSRETHAECVEKIQDAIRLKAAKEYEKDIWLLVSFDDGLLTPRDISLPELGKITDTIITESRTEIGRVVVIGWSGKLYLDREAEVR